VLNHLNPLVRRIAALPDADLTGVAVEALYGQSLLQARRPLRPVDQALVNRAFGELLEWATPAPPTPHRDRSDDTQETER
jgi:molecular chaperone HtpG